MDNPISIPLDNDDFTFRFERTEPVLLDVDKSPEALDDLINSHQVVVSLLPWPLHPKIAERLVYEVYLSISSST